MDAEKSRDHMSQKRPLCLESLRRKASHRLWYWSLALRKSINDRCKVDWLHVEEWQSIFLGTGIILVWTDGL